MELLAQQGRAAEAIKVSAARCSVVWDGGQRQLVGMLVGLDRVEEAVALLQAHFDDPDPALGEQLSRMLGRGEIGDAVWLAQVESAEPDMSDQLHVAELLVKYRRFGDARDLLQTLVDTGSPWDDQKVVELLAACDRADDL